MEIKLSVLNEVQGPKCPICGEAFTSRKRMNNHKNHVHRSEILARKVSKRQRRAKKNRGESDGKQLAPEPV